MKKLSYADGLVDGLIALTTVKWVGAELADQGLNVTTVFGVAVAILIVIQVWRKLGRA